MTTGQLIKAARKRGGLTQSDLAAKLGIPYQSIGQWERDIRNPKYDTIKKIAAALEIDWTELVPEEAQSTLIVDHIKTRLRGEDSSEVEDAQNQNPSIEDKNNLYIEIAKSFLQLNAEGKLKAIERIQELTEIERYRKDDE